MEVVFCAYYGSDRCTSCDFVYFPPEFKESLTTHTLAGLTTFLGITAIVARLVSQEKRDDKVLKIVT